MSPRDGSMTDRDIHSGAVRRQQLGGYLAEFAFHYNERSSPCGVRFERLLEAMLAAAPGSARSLVGGTAAPTLPSGPGPSCWLIDAEIPPFALFRQRLRSRQL